MNTVDRGQERGFVFVLAHRVEQLVRCARESEGLSIEILLKSASNSAHFLYYTTQQ